MRRLVRELFGAWAVLLSLSGCANEKTIRPPVIEQEYVLPPNDPRYSRFPQYPEKTLNNWPKKDTANDMNGPPAGFSRPGRMGAGY
jgi:hypothetical protein